MELAMIRYNEDGLVPTIVQDANTGAVLMMAWMNEEALRLTLETGLCHYFSRSRKKLWKKGETSGHFQHVRSVRYDCDGDCVLVGAVQDGVACHTGEYSCFHHTLLEEEGLPAGSCVLRALYDVIGDRRAHPKEGSYTNYLFEKGIDKICKKVGEEAAEVIIAAKNRNPDEVRYEVADLIYHILVLLTEQGVPVDDVFRELAKRHKPVSTDKD